MVKLIIIGGKGTAINIGESIIDAANNYNEKIELLGYSIDDKSLGDNINGLPILCSIKELYKFYEKFNDVKFLFCLYRPDLMRKRSELRNSLCIPSSKFYTFIHPSVYISKSTRIGVGNVVLSNSSIHSNTSIGNFNIINSNVIIEHDTFVGDSNFIAAGSVVGANVNIENYVFIGLNSSIRENCNLENESFIGMSSNVLIRKIPKKTMWFGNPALIKK
jgi:sugar O-acyltransferase (sialic acid O-acetyltransferase NeuD family)